MTEVFSPQFHAVSTARKCRGGVDAITKYVVTRSELSLIRALQVGTVVKTVFNGLFSLLRRHWSWCIRLRFVIARPISSESSAFSFVEN